MLGLNIGRFELESPINARSRTLSTCVPSSAWQLVCSSSAPLIIVEKPSYHVSTPRISTSLDSIRAKSTFPGRTGGIFPVEIAVEIDRINDGAMAEYSCPSELELYSFAYKYRVITINDHQEGCEWFKMELTII